MKIFLIWSCLFVLPLEADDWSGFRGSFGNGSTKQTSTPKQWNETTGVRWSVELPKGGNGSPIVVGSRVFVTSAEDDDGTRRATLCFDADSGEQLWKRTVQFDKKMPTHKTNPYGGSTPACNGAQVVVWHGSAGLFVYDIDGNERWSRNLGEFRHMWGYGSSPVISGGRVILHTGPGKQVFVLALDLESGRELWRYEEPVDGNGERNAKDHYMGSWSTPVLMQNAGKAVVVCAFATRVCGIDAETGKLLWYCEGLSGPKGDLAYSSPMIENELCVMIGGFKGPAIGFRIAGSGDITSDSRLWRNDTNPQNIGTGVMLNAHVYRVGAGPNLIECMDAHTGNIVWRERTDAKAFWSSISNVGSTAYVTDQGGTTLVFELSPSGFKKIAANPLNDTCNATPALANDCVYIRTYKKLWCIDGQP